MMSAIRILVAETGGVGREGEMGIGGLKGIEHATELSARQWSCIYDHAQPRPSWPSHEEG